MQQPTKKDNSQIQSLSEKFTASMLGNEISSGMCFTVCFPLSLHLANNNIENSIIHGFKDETSHYWLKLNDNNETTVDPTISQFYNNIPPIFIGTKPEAYRENKKEWFNETYTRWLNPLLQGLTDRLPKHFPLKVLLTINLKAATVLNTEIEQMNSREDFIESTLRQIYFEGIYQIINTYVGQKLKEELSLPNEFDNLLSKAINKSSMP